MVRTSGPAGTGAGSNRTASTGALVAAESKSRIRVESCPPTEKKCGSSGSVTAVAWTPVIEAGAGDGDGVGDGVDEGADDAGGEDGDPAVADGVGARAAGRQALAVRLSAAKIATNVGPRRTVRL